MRWWTLCLVVACEETGSKSTTSPTGHTGETTVDTPSETGDTGPIDADGDGFAAGDDCDDANPRAFPGAAPTCRAEDADCDGVPEERARVPEDHATVQAAIDAGETRRICLGDGSHPGFTVDDGTFEVGGSAQAVLDGGALPAIVTTGGALVVADLAVTGAAGGLRAEDGEVTLRGVVFEGVRCTDCEGGVIYSDADLRVQGVQVLDAAVTGDDLRGGLVFVDGGTAELVDLTVQGGSVTTTGFLHGGAVAVVGPDATLTRFVVRDLTLDVGSLQGGALYLFSGDVTARNVVVTGLQVTAATEVEGVAVAGSGSFSTLHLDHVAIAGNSAAAPTCTGSVIFAVSALGDLSHGALAQNVFTCAQVNGGAVAIEAADPWTVRWTDVWGHADGDWSGMPDPSGTDGNLSVDPGFVDVAGGDLRLVVGSPLVDAGDPSTLDRDGSTADIGGFGGPQGW